MKVILVHNATAGAEEHSEDEIEAAIRRGGHEVIARVARAEALAPALRGADCDLVAVAGGDGTVGAVALVLVGSPVPLAVIPVGTANNIARTIGLESDMSTATIISTWRDARTVELDAATVVRGRHERPFFEAFGFGAFPQVMMDTEDAPRPDDPEQTLERDRRLLRTAVAEAPTRAYTVRADGEDRSGHYALVELMNIPYLGPGISMAPRADLGDGLLDVVLVGDAERRLLVDHIDAIGRGVPSELAVPVVRAARVLIATGETRCHHDGELCEPPPAGHGSIELEVVARPRALRVLVPC